MRLQSGRRLIPAGQDRRQTAHYAILEYQHGRISSIGERKVAVCLLPGTEIAFENQVKRRPTGFQLSVFRRHTRPLTHKVARFRQINRDNPCTHHDALEFPDGQVVLLTHLRVGQHATVLQLPANASVARSPEEPALRPAKPENGWV